MCEKCGCGSVEHFGVHPMQAPPAKPIDLHSDSDAPLDLPNVPRQEILPSAGLHFHPHTHEHSHPHVHPQTQSTRVVSLETPILEKNIRLAERNRGFLKAKRIFSINLLSSPGAGKTTLIEKTVERIPAQLAPAIIVGDLETTNDAKRIRAKGVPVVQITTGAVCHLDAEMVSRGLERLDLDRVRLLIVENVGNLVCPASFDLGEDKRVVLFSVTEGEDKPLKYPPIFHSANLVLITKIDLAEAVQFDRDQALRNIRQIAHHADCLELSAKTGQGMDAWLEWLRKSSL